MKNRIHTAMLAFESIFAILMLPDMQWLDIKKRKSLQHKAFQISPPCCDKKVRNTGGVHILLVLNYSDPLLPQ